MRTLSFTFLLLLASCVEEQKTQSQSSDNESITQILVPEESPLPESTPTLSLAPVDIVRSGSVLNAGTLLTPETIRGPIKVTPDAGKFEMRFDKTHVLYGDTFKVYIENNSSKTVTIKKSTFNIVGSVSGTTYLTQPDLSVLAFGSCPETILAGGACFVQVRNDQYLAPEKDTTATVVALIEAKSTGESSFTAVSSASNNQYLTLYGDE